MSLNFDFTGIKGGFDVTHYATNAKDRKKKVGYIRPKTEALIWLTIHVDIYELTKKTIDEFWWRLQFMMLIDNGYYNKQPDVQEKYGISISPWNITYADLESHIGLRTNAIQRTRRQFCLKQIRVISERVQSGSKYPHPIKEGTEGSDRFDKAFGVCNKSWEKFKRKEAKKVSDSKE